MKVILVAEDINGGVHVNTQVIASISEEENGISEAGSSATALGDFLMKAVEVWQATQHMDMPQCERYINSITVKQRVN